MRQRRSDSHQIRNHARRMALCLVVATVLMGCGSLQGGNVSNGRMEKATPATIQVSDLEGIMAIPAKTAIVGEKFAISIPRIKFENAPLGRIISWLNDETRRNDPGREGVRISFDQPELARCMVTLHLRRVPLRSVIRFLTAVCGLRYRVTAKGIHIVSAGESGGAVLTRSFRIPPGAARSMMTWEAPPRSKFLAAQPDFKKWLEGHGVSFPLGTMISYDETGDVFRVHHASGTLDQIEVLLWKAQAACDDVDAQFHLGCRHIRIVNMTWNDLTEAGGWFRQAAERGYPPAQFALGLMCAEGAGIPMDAIESYQWLELASIREWGTETKPGLGTQEAAKALRTVAARMTPDQIAEGKRRAHVFVPRHVSEPQ